MKHSYVYLTIGIILFANLVSVLIDESNVFSWIALVLSSVMLIMQVIDSILDQRDTEIYDDPASQS